MGTFGTPGPLQLGAINIYAWDETGTPDFYVDDSGMIYGVKAMSRLVVDYMNMK